MRIFCFSGSGNSYSVATAIGAHFSVKPELITSFKNKSMIKVTDSQTGTQTGVQIGIVAPVYINDIPKVVKEFILKLSFADTNAYVFAILTSGSGKNKNGFKSINLALSQRNARLALAYDISMPSSFQERADMDAVLSAAPQKAAEIAKAIEDRRENYASQGSIRLPKNFTKPTLLNRALSHMTVTETCAGCGLCCKLCPTNNIVIEDGKAIHGKDCIACTACAAWCPVQAVSNRMLKGQYHHPEVSAEDLLPIQK